jgi:hypothetical protein
MNFCTLTTLPLRQDSTWCFHSTGLSRTAAHWSLVLKLPSSGCQVVREMHFSFHLQNQEMAGRGRTWTWADFSDQGMLTWTPWWAVDPGRGGWLYSWEKVGETGKQMVPNTVLCKSSWAHYLCTVWLHDSVFNCGSETGILFSLCISMLPSPYIAHSLKSISGRK